MNISFPSYLDLENKYKGEFPIDPANAVLANINWQKLLSTCDKVKANDFSEILSHILIAIDIKYRTLIDKPKFTILENPYLRIIDKKELRNLHTDDEWRKFGSGSSFRDVYNINKMEDLEEMGVICLKTEPYRDSKTWKSAYLTEFGLITAFFCYKYSVLTKNCDHSKIKIDENLFSHLKNQDGIKRFPGLLLNRMDDILLMGRLLSEKQLNKNPMANVSSIYGESGAGKSTFLSLLMEFQTQISWSKKAKVIVVNLTDLIARDQKNRWFIREIENLLDINSDSETFSDLIDSILKIKEPIYLCLDQFDHLLEYSRFDHAFIYELFEDFINFFSKKTKSNLKILIFHNSNEQLTSYLSENHPKIILQRDIMCIDPIPLDNMNIFVFENLLRVLGKHLTNFKSNQLKKIITSLNKLSSRIFTSLFKNQNIPPFNFVRIGDKFISHIEKLPEIDIEINRLKSLTDYEFTFFVSNELFSFDSDFRYLKDNYPSIYSYLVLKYKKQTKYDRKLLKFDEININKQSNDEISKFKNNNLYSGLFIIEEEYFGFKHDIILEEFKNSNIELPIELREFIEKVSTMKTLITNILSQGIHLDLPPNIIAYIGENQDYLQSIVENIDIINSLDEMDICEILVYLLLSNYEVKRKLIQNFDGTLLIDTIEKRFAHILSSSMITPDILDRLQRFSINIYLHIMKDKFPKEILAKLISIILEYSTNQMKYDLFLEIFNKNIKIAGSIIDCFLEILDIEWIKGLYDYSNQPAKRLNDYYINYEDKFNSSIRLLWVKLWIKTLSHKDTYSIHYYRNRIQKLQSANLTDADIVNLVNEIFYTIEEGSFLEFILKLSKDLTIKMYNQSLSLSLILQILEQIYLENIILDKEPEDIHHIFLMIHRGEFKIFRLQSIFLDNLLSFSVLNELLINKNVISKPVNAYNFKEIDKIDGNIINRITELAKMKIKSIGLNYLVSFEISTYMKKEDMITELGTVIAWFIEKDKSDKNVKSNDKEYHRVIDSIYRDNLEKLTNLFILSLRSLKIHRKLVEIDKLIQNTKIDQLSNSFHLISNLVWQSIKPNEIEPIELINEFQLYIQADYSFISSVLLLMHTLHKFFDDLFNLHNIDIRLVQTVDQIPEEVRDLVPKLVSIMNEYVSKSILPKILNFEEITEYYHQIEWFNLLAFLSLFNYTVPYTDLDGSKTKEFLLLIENRSQLYLDKDNEEALNNIANNFNQFENSLIAFIFAPLVGKTMESYLKSISENPDFFSKLSEYYDNEFTYHTQSETIRSLFLKITSALLISNDEIILENYLRTLNKISLENKFGEIVLEEMITLLLNYSPPSQFFKKYKELFLSSDSRNSIFKLIYLFLYSDNENIFSIAELKNVEYLINAVLSILKWDNHDLFLFNLNIFEKIKCNNYIIILNNYIKLRSSLENLSFKYNILQGISDMILHDCYDTQALFELYMVNYDENDIIQLIDEECSRVTKFLNSQEKESYVCSYEEREKRHKTILPTPSVLNSINSIVHKINSLFSNSLQSEEKYVFCIHSHRVFYKRLLDLKYSLDQYNLHSLCQNDGIKVEIEKFLFKFKSTFLNFQGNITFEDCNIQNTIYNFNYMETDKFPLMFVSSIGALIGLSFNSDELIEVVENLVKYYTTLQSNIINQIRENNMKNRSSINIATGKIKKTEKIFSGLDHDRSRRATILIHLIKSVYQFINLRNQDDNNILSLYQSYLSIKDQFMIYTLNRFSSIEDLFIRQFIRVKSLNYLVINHWNSLSSIPQNNTIIHHLGLPNKSEKEKFLTTYPETVVFLWPNYMSNEYAFQCIELLENDTSKKQILNEIPPYLFNLRTINSFMTYN